MLTTLVPRLTLRVYRSAIWLSDHEAWNAVYIIIRKFVSYLRAAKDTYREQQTHDTQTEEAGTHLGNSAVVNLDEFSNALIRYGNR